ncbi:hypothetical protein FYZ48_25380 [Gimesia chilikensis]|uniref:hypothetical protein n=1 Tax=Gimesia chilikensis TaxID=2605989 RepID=UPI0011ED2EB2|nr:hypothetical protein [Gimesia chilikensis]KAA0131481.1 hypothetical protein FYZ48_25380 [Gimesia chilikensis]
MNKKKKFAFSPYNLRATIEPFRGIYDLRQMFELLNEFVYDANAILNLLPQCFTQDNCEENVKFLKDKLSPSSFSFVVTNSRRFDLDEDETPYVNNADWYAHVVIDGKLDPRYLEGLKVLKSYFSDEKWDSYDFVGDRPYGNFDDPEDRKKCQG